MQLPTEADGRESDIDRRVRIMREALERIAGWPCECHPDRLCHPCIACLALEEIG